MPRVFLFFSVRIRVSERELDVGVSNRALLSILELIREFICYSPSHAEHMERERSHNTRDRTLSCVSRKKEQL